jgi:anaerobic sulfite reductase subunit A
MKGKGEKIYMISPLFLGVNGGEKMMEINSEYKELMDTRENLYRFLGRLYKSEVDQCLLEQMQMMRFPAESGNAELNEGYRLIGKYLRNPGSDPLTDLAVDYARVFLGAGTYEGTVANPYESVYTSPERLIMQDARDKVVEAYFAKGLEKAETFAVPEDHISLELELMIFMCQETRRALDAHDWQSVSKSLLEQMAFLVRHLLNWIPDFCRDIEKCSQTDFYKAVAKITNGYLRLDRSLLDALISESVIEVTNSTY